MINQLSRYVRFNLFTLFLRHPLHTSESNACPFFILSAGRSGSTLLRKILLRSKHTSIPPETNSFIPTLTNLYIKHNHMAWDKLAKLLIHQIKKANLLMHWNIELQEKDQHIIQYELKDKSLQGFIYYIYHKYTEQYHAEASLWGDKTPLLIYHTDLLSKVFPHAKYIFMTRDGRDVVSSFYMHQIYTDLDTLCKRWIYSVKKSYSILNKKGSKKVLIVKYESLVENPFYEIEKICAFLKIPFSQEYLNNTAVHLGDDYQLHHANVKNTITMNRIGAWKKDLTKNEQKQINNTLRKTLVAMKYR